MPKSLRWLLLFAFLHGLWYAAIVHPWQAPDEYLHYEYMRLIDDKRSLDLYAEDRTSAIQWDAAESMWTFEHNRYRNLPTPDEANYRALQTPLGSRVFSPQSPLYYLVSLPIYWLLRDASPLTQLYALRIFSVLLLCLNVWLTYQLAGWVFGSTKALFQLAPAAIVAIFPQYVFISASYNNDNLAPPLVTASLLFLVRGYRQNAKPGQFALALLFGLLALTAKRTAVAIIPVLGLGLLGYAIQWLRSNRRWARVGGVLVWAGGAIFVIVLTRFLVQPPTIPHEIARHLRLSPNALIQLMASLSSKGRLDQIDWRWFFSVMNESFWSQFGWLTLRIPVWLSYFFALLTVVLALGILGALGRHLKNDENQQVIKITLSVLLLIAGAVFTLIAMIAQYLVSPEFYTPQGRYLFPFLPALVILGLWSWLAYWPRRLQSPALIAAWIGFVLYDLYAWAFVILPGWYS